MATGQLEQFNCDGCGKSYRWKAELAGKRVKCKCGHTMTVPQPPVAVESDDPFADALSAMAEAEQSGTVSADADLPRCPSCAGAMSHGSTLCTQCGYNVNTGKKAGGKKAAPVAMGVGGADGGEFALAPSAAVAAKSSAPGGVLAYAGMPVRRSLSARGAENAGDNNIGEPFKDLYLPIGLFLLGLITTFCEARYGRGIASVPGAMLFTAFTTIIDIVLVFVGIMIAVRVAGLALGPIGPALIKIAAVSVLPGAVAGMLFHIVGLGGFFIVWITSLVLTYGMFMGLLELDFQETMICTAIIWFVRTWIGYALVFAILSGFGFSMGNSATSSAAMSAMTSGPSSSKLQAPTPKKPTVTAAQLDAVAQTALSSPGAMEAIAWTQMKIPNKKNEIYRSEFESSQQVFEGLYKSGAQRIMVTRTLDRGGDEILARQIVITLPTAKAQRRRLILWGLYTTDENGGAPQIDVGQKFLTIDYDAPKPLPQDMPKDEFETDPNDPSSSQEQ